MKSSTHFNQGEMMEQGRIIARAMRDLKVEQKKNMIRAVQRRETMLRNAAEKELFK